MTATRCQLDAKQFGAAERALQVASALDEIETLNLRSNCITSAGPGELIPNGFIDFVESVLSRAPHLRLLDVSECAAVDNLETGCEYILQCLLKGCNSRAANGIATPLSLRFEGLGQFSTVLKKLEHSFPQSCVLDVGGDMLKSLLMQLVSS